MPTPEQDYFDAPLTPKGWSQCLAAHLNLKQGEWHERISIVATSPLSRTIQTTLGVLSGASEADDLSNISTNLKIVALEECRERYGEGLAM